jgi:hypothetical protein
VTTDKAAAAEQIKGLYRLFVEKDCTMVEVGGEESRGVWSGGDGDGRGGKARGPLDALSAQLIRCLQPLSAQAGSGSAPLHCPRPHSASPGLLPLLLAALLTAADSQSRPCILQHCSACIPSPAAPR